MVYTKDEGKRLVIEAGKKLVRSGLIVRTWGNISAKVSKNSFVITPSGRDYEGLEPQDIVEVRISDGAVLSDGKPSSEVGVHLEAYRLRKDIGFVIHTHQLNASALSVLGKDITNISGYMEKADSVLGKVVPCGNYAMSSTKELAMEMSQTISRYPLSNAILMKNHGALCLGEDYDKAFRVADTLENVAEFRFREMFPRAIAKEESLFFSEENVRKYLKVFEKGFDPDYKKRKDIYEKNDAQCIIYSHAPYTKMAAALGRDMKPYIDDAAQILGTSVKSLKNKCTYKEIAKALDKRNAVLIEKVGAVCTGASYPDAEAAALVLEKAAQAYLLADSVGKIRPVSYFTARKERSIYINKYSKLK